MQRLRFWCGLALLLGPALFCGLAVFELPAQEERFRSESWQFRRGARADDLRYGSASERYSAALGLFLGSVGRSQRDVEAAIEAMRRVYDEARALVRTEAGRRELVIFESMLGWFTMGLAETADRLRDKEDAAAEGLRYLDALLREHPDNLDVLFIYVRSTWFVPTNYEDLTEDIEYAGRRFLSRSSARPGDELGRAQRNVVLIALANVAVEQNDFDTARSYFRDVDSRSLRSLSVYGSARLEDVYSRLEEILGGRGGRVRTSW